MFRWIQRDAHQRPNSDEEVHLHLLLALFGDPVQVSKFSKDSAYLETSLFARLSRDCFLDRLSGFDMAAWDGPQARKGDICFCTLNDQQFRRACVFD